MRRSTVLRDAIWGDVSLGPRELAVIDTAAFQRLRRIKQLGMTDLVFPGATHTRFEHSIGVYHLAGVALERLKAVADGPAFSPSDERALLAAALTHDVGHYPFSHAIEELEVDQVRRHTEIARDLIVGDELAAVFEDHWDVDPGVVADLVTGPSPGRPALTEGQELLRSLLDSSLDVDKLDYLVRDARGANVPYGLVDTQRLIGAFSVWRDEDGRARLAVEGRGVSALQSLVFAKHLMFATVYWHHACRSAVVMLLRSIQTALRTGLLTAESIERSDDAALLASCAAAGGLVAELGSRIRERRLYKRAVEIAVDDDRFARLEALWFRPMQRAVVEDGWAAAVGAEEGSVLLDIPEPREIVVDLPVIVDGEDVSDWDHVSGLSTQDLERFQRWVRRIRVFARDAEVAEKLRAAGVV